MKLQELVNSHYDSLNENDIHIWEYILAHNKECENLTIDELASRCYVSRTTVMRFAQRIGLKGYAELKSYLRMNNRKNDKCLSLEDMYNEMTSLLSSKSYDFSKWEKEGDLYRQFSIYDTSQYESKLSSSIILNK